MGEAMMFIGAAYSVQWAGSLLLAAVLGRLFRAYNRRHLLIISASWLALSFYYLGSGVALYSANAGVMPWQPVRVGASVTALTAAYWQAALLLLGTREAAVRRRIRPATLRALLLAGFVVAVVSTTFFVGSLDHAIERVFVRVGVKSLVVGVAFLAAGVGLRKARYGRGLGSGLVAAAFILFGIHQLHYFGVTLWQVVSGRFLTYGAYLTLVEFLLLVTIALGSVVWLLEVERRRVVMAIERIDYLSNYDETTGLPNRSLFLDRLRLVVDHARADRRTAAVLVVDVDDFDAINDSYGRGMGNDILRALGARLQRIAEPVDTLARVGNDEFALLLTDPGSPADVNGILEAVVDESRRPFHLRNESVYVTVCVGAALYPGQCASGDELIVNAEAALHGAQQAGPSTRMVYAPALNSLRIDRLGFEAALRRALDERSFTLHYQPVINLQTMRTVAFEALIRWQHPERGTLLPSEFLALAERLGLLPSLEWWVLETACAQLRRCDELGGRRLQIAVNLSARTFLLPDMAARIGDIVDASGVGTERLVLEITEGAAVHQPEATARVLHTLKDRGIRIAIDDFGTGYNSLSHLRNLPVDVIKMDRSFVRNVAAHDRDAALASAIVALAHGFDMPVVAEGVETEEQRRVLQVLGFDLAQGFLFSRPVPESDCEALLRAEEDAT